MKKNHQELYNIAKKFEREKKYDEALKRYKELKDYNVSDFELDFNYAKLLIRTGNNVELGKEILESLEHNYLYDWVILEMGKADFKLGDLESGMEKMKDLIERDTRCMNDAIYEMVKCFITTKEYDKAERYIEMLYNDEKYKTAGAIVKARMHNSCDEFEKTKEILSKIIYTKKDQEGKALYEYGIAEIGLGNHENAVKIFKDVIKYNGGKTEEAYHYLGLSELYISDYKSAKEHLKKAMDTNIYKKYDSKLQYARILKFEGNYEESKKMLNDLLDTAVKNKALLELIFFDLHEEKYDDVADKVSQVDKLCENDDFLIGIEYLKRIKFIVKYRSNMLEKEDLKNISYCERQLVNYSKNIALEHIRNHYNENSKKEKHSLFNSDIDIEDLYEDAKEKIKNLTPNFTLVDKYYVRYDKPIGTLDGVETNILAVVTNINTKDIIAMYPTIDIKGYNRFELTKEEKPQKQMKKESAIEKFYRRYGNNINKN